jgi:hypothetical protein
MELEESNQLLAEIAQHFHQVNVHNFIDFRGLSPCQIFFSFEATHGLFFSLIVAGVLATCLNPDRPLPVEVWRNDGHLYHVVGPEVDRLFALLNGSLKQADGSLLEEAALALCRIREEVLPPNDLFVCHSRLLNALLSGDWVKSVGDALAKIITAQWMHVIENQRFALTSPALYAPLLKKKCEDMSRSGFSRVAAILQIAAVAAGVSLADSGIEFLTQLALGEESSSSTT